MRPIPEKKKSSYQQELERRANDLLRVYNPTDTDYVVEWDRKNGTKLFRVPRREEAVLPRYIAEKYIREMYDKMINDTAMEAIKKENERRIKVGMAVMDKTLRTGEQQQFESKFYMGNDDKAKEMVALLYVGLETEFGVDRIIQSQEKIDDRPVFEKAMESVVNEKNNPTPQKVEPQDPLKCIWPGCDFVAKSNLGLISHKRIHREPE